MRKLSLILCAVLLCASILCSCSGSTNPGEDLMNDTAADENLAFKFKNGETEMPTSYTSYKTYATDFAFEMLRSMYNSDGNTALASAGLYGQLSVLENGASDTTLREIKNLTGKNQPIDDLNACNAYFFSRLKSLGKSKNGSYLNINNNFFFGERVNPNQQFLQKNANFYKLNMFRMDFSDKDCTDKINDYVSTITNNNVKTILSSPVSESCDIVTTSTSLMRDKWLSGYDRQDTSTAKFNGKNGAVDAEYLTSTEFFLKGKRCTGFEKSFKTTPCKFIALLPNEDINIYKFIRDLNYDEYHAVTSSMNVFKTCKASLPQFSVKYEDSLNDALNKSGVYELFNQKGNLKNLALNFTGSVGNVAQSFSLDINAAGVGSGKAEISDAKKKSPEAEVILNRPFVFLIVDNESYIPIYAGIVAEI